MSSDIGIGGQVFADGSDLSRGLSAFRATFVQGNVDNTRLRTPARFRTHAVTLDGGSMGFTGDLPDDDADALVYAQDFLTRDDGPRTLFMAPFGADVGKLALIGKGIRTTMELGAEVEAILSLNAEFEITAASPGIMPGLTLFSPNLEGGTLTQNEQVDLVFTNADPNQFFALNAAGTSETFAFQAGASNATLKTGIEALPAYTGRTATVTGSLTGTTLKSGSKRIEFDGAVDVPALELTQGVLHALTLISATGTKTIYGNVVVNVSSSTAQTVQDDVRAKGGQYGAVVVTKTGSGGTAVYTFAYPVGATPADLTQPTVTANEVQTVSAPGVDAVTINAQSGGSAQTINSTDDVTTKQNKLALVYNKTAGHIVVTDSSTAPSGGVVTFDFDGPGSTAGPWTQNSTENGAPNFSNQYTAGAGNIRVYWTGSVWAIANADGDSVYTATGTANAGPPVGAWSPVFAAPPASLSNKQMSGGTPGTTAFTATFSGASVSGVNQSQMTSPTGGVTFNTTQQGGVGPDATTSVSVTQGGDATAVAYTLVQQGGSFTGVNVISAVTSGGTVRDFTTTTTTTKGMLVTLQSLLAVVGTSTWKIQHAPDNAGTAGTFVDLLSFDVVNSTGAQTKEVPVGTTIYPYIRARCTAITGSVQVAIAAARRF